MSATNEGSAAASPRLGLHGQAIAVLVVGLLVTAALATSAYAVHDRDEDRLLRQQVLAASALLVSTVGSLQTPLVSAAELAEEGGGDAAAFEQLMGREVGPGRRFVGASLWTAGGDGPIVALGATPGFQDRSPDEVLAFFASVDEGEGLAVLNLLDLPNPRIGAAVQSMQADAGFVVYAELGLPEDRTSVPQTDSAYSDLDYAIYVGDSEERGDLLLASTPELPLTGRTAAQDIPLGDSQLRLVATPRGVLGSDWGARSWWLLAFVGSLLALGAAGLTERLVRSRADARRLSEAIGFLYAEQRSVAQTLQQSLLPDELPEIRGVELGVRYVPGLEEVDIGGDWYDAIHLGDRRVLLVVGDVSGRGVQAATVMAALRYAVRAYGSQGDAPHAILEKLNGLLSVTRDGHFATVLCAVADFDAREITIASAGHLPPVLLAGSTGMLLDTEAGPPVGVPTAAAQYPATTVTLPPSGTLLVFTDGLVERRGETIDVGIERLRAAASGGTETLEAQLSRLLEELTPDGSDDDTAILGVRWRT